MEKRRRVKFPLWPGNLHWCFSFLGCVWFSCELWKSCCELWAVKKLLWAGSCEKAECRLVQPAVKKLKIHKMSVTPLRPRFVVYIQYNRNYKSRNGMENYHTWVKKKHLSISYMLSFFPPQQKHHTPLQIELHGAPAHTLCPCLL
jgi:hypothetical protein